MKTASIVLVFIAGLTTGHLLSGEPGSLASAQEVKQPAANKEAASVLLFGPMFPNPSARVGVPVDLLARLDEEMRWAVFMGGVLRAPQFRGVVDFDSVHEPLSHLKLSLMNALDDLEGAKAMKEAERAKVFEEVDKNVKAAHEHRLKASAEMFKLLPSKVEHFQADIDLLAGK